MVNIALKIFCLSVLVLLLAVPSLAQNTKGDRPAATPRETRFKTPKKQKQKKVKQDGERPGRRVAPSSSSPAKGDRPGRPIRPDFSRSKASGQERPWKGDITNRRIRPRGTSRAAHVYPQPNTTNYSSRELKRKPPKYDNPNVKRVRRMQREEERKAHVGRPIRPVFHKTRPSQRERPWTGDLTGRRIRATPADKTYTQIARNYPRAASTGRRVAPRAGIVPSRVSGRARNIFTGRSFYVNNRSSKPPRVGSGDQKTFRLLTGPGSQKPRFRSGKMAPRSASASYMSRRSTNVWAHFPRPKRKGERAITTDLAGKKLRGKNYQTQRPTLINPTLRYQKRVAAGERPYKGPAAGGYVSRTRPGQRAWKGDIAHYRIRGGQPPGKERAFLGFLKGGGFQSATRPGPRGHLTGKSPGIGARGVGSYQGNIKAGRRPLRDQGEGYTGNIKTGKRGFRDQGEQYTGNIRAGKRGFRDQGEEYTGNIRAGKRGFRDQGEEYSGNIRTGRRAFRDQGEEYTGNIRVAKRGFNYQGEEHRGSIKGRRGFTDQGEEYSGNIKVGKRGFTYQGEEHRGNIRGARRGFTDQGEEFTGNIKARRPDKGGGSVSGKLWNNNETPIVGKAYNDNAYRVTRYSGNMKARRPDKGGGSVSGKLWNNNETPITGKVYADDAYRITRYSGNIKAKRSEKGGGSISGKLWNNNEKPIDVRTPKNEKGGDYTGNVKLARNHYTRNPNSADGALKGVRATAATERAGSYSRGVRRDWDYIRNPSSDDEAQRTREPGRAFARSANYNGNIKVRKFELFGKRDNLHPDARFVKTNKNNVPEEKDMLTNFKLWWARLFRKSETHPDHLKEKGRTPRYDKGESGLWYE